MDDVVEGELPFHEFLRHCRHKSGLSLEALAERGQISLSFLSRIENGRQLPNRERFGVIAELIASEHADMGTKTRDLLVASRDVAELVQRFDLSEPVARLAVFRQGVGREHEHPRLAAAIEALPRRQRNGLRWALDHLGSETDIGRRHKADGEAAARTAEYRLSEVPNK